ncbi:11635_t:CDS:1, partial [Ambispora gerdemannii]
TCSPIAIAEEINLTINLIINNSSFKISKLLNNSDSDKIEVIVAAVEDG